MIGTLKMMKSLVGLGEVNYIMIMKWASAQVPPTPPNWRGGTGKQPGEYDVAHDPSIYIYIYT